MVHNDDQSSELLTLLSFKMTTLTILSEIVVILCICSACISIYDLFSSQLKISHVLNGPTAQNQHKSRGPTVVLESAFLMLQKYIVE